MRREKMKGVAMPMSDPASRGKPRRRRSFFDQDAEKASKQAVPSEILTATELFRLLDTLVDEGIALTIGRTSDGGALSIVFLVDGKRIKRYPSAQDDWLALVAEFEG